jgi:hypothetical protein
MILEKVRLHAVSNAQSLHASLQVVGLPRL